MSTTRVVGECVFVEFIRLSLYEREQIDAFEPLTGGRRFSREEWLRVAFAAQREFQHRGHRFTYGPDRKLTDDTLVIGRIGRELLARDNEPPEEGMHERVHPEWQAS